MKTVLTHPDAYIEINEIDENRVITIFPKENNYVQIKHWVTRYSIDLIQNVLSVKGPGFLCDEIMRDEDPTYVEHSFRWDILSYISSEENKDCKILDFGSGSGASSIVLARLFPEAEIVGVELIPEYVDLACNRVVFHGIDNRVHFLLAPDSTNLPIGIGDFDFIIVSAVFEHMLPEERQLILPLLWLHLKQGGILFLDQTPYRWFPIELHTTGLPFINYMPEKLALWYARKFSKHVKPDSSWLELLRRGVRGGTIQEIQTILAKDGISPEAIIPSRLGVKDHIDLWYHLSSTTRYPLLKRFMLYLFRLIRFVSGKTVIPTLSLAFKKERY